MGGHQGPGACRASEEGGPRHTCLDLSCSGRQGPGCTSAPQGSNKNTSESLAHHWCSVFHLE